MGLISFDWVLGLKIVKIVMLFKDAEQWARGYKGGGKVSDSINKGGRENTSSLF